MTTQKNQGERLLASRIDEIARETPERVWVSMPRDDNDLSKGFLDVTFRQFSNAINHAAHWLDLVLGSPTSDFEGFAYIGPPDARVAIIAVATVNQEESSKLSAQVLQLGQVEGFVGPPLLLKALCQDPVSLELVRNLDFINWGGAPLEKAIGDLLKDYVRMSPAFGTTEAGPYLTLLCEDPDDWQYYRFRDDALWQQIFMVYPELQKYHTKDLFRKHPKKDGLWIYSGRTDDVFILAGGSIVGAAVLEELIAKQPLVHTALVGGNGRERPFLLVELNRSNSAAVEDSDTTVSTFWPAVEAANETCYDYVKILKELVIVADPSKPFSRSGKETVLR
ncbi:hypothetical protein HYALB_00004108 [Hymenoscyphus albidus]|uniref:Uncharacterized protein n=1 Tax=Hymenoscyphus albidus TaxID=595503 RepID=A0A9N9M5W6_9HELO|nr:hypothetical protein HYALB_00004108 [Hymenoscyphus albidus]